MTGGACWGLELGIGLSVGVTAVPVQVMRGEGVDDCKFWFDC